MFVLTLAVELHLPEARSLKDKRMVVKSLRDKLRNRFEISAGEVGLHDAHQRARLAVSFVAGDHASADAILERVLSFVETNTDATLTGWTTEVLEFDEMASLGVPHFS